MWALTYYKRGALDAVFGYLLHSFFQFADVKRKQRERIHFNSDVVRLMVTVSLSRWRPGTESEIIKNELFLLQTARPLPYTDLTADTTANEGQRCLFTTNRFHIAQCACVCVVGILYSCIGLIAFPDRTARVGRIALTSRATVGRARFIINGCLNIWWSQHKAADRGAPESRNVDLLSSRDSTDDDDWWYAVADRVWDALSQPIPSATSLSSSSSYCSSMKT